METREYRTIDRSKWGPGPWQNEPDKRQWPDRATLLPCLLVRHERLGHLCGYVGVSPGHPAHGLDYSSAEIDVDVHGELIFAGGGCQGGDENAGICHVPGAGEPDTVWWFGFDCAHAWDILPGRCYPEDEAQPWFKGRYRSAAYVTRHCTALAEQLDAMVRA